MIVAESECEMLLNLRSMLTEVFRLRNEGASCANLAHSQGLVDGYMRALVNGGVATEKELLKIVTDQRRAVNGPATREFASEEFLAA